MEMTAQKPQNSYKHAYAFPQSICIQNSSKNIVGCIDKFYGNFPRNTFASRPKKNLMKESVIIFEACFYTEDEPSTADVLNATRRPLLLDSPYTHSSIIPNTATLQHVGLYFVESRVEGKVVAMLN
jgi:hypothetical protein